MNIIVSGLMGALVAAIINVVFNAWTADRRQRSARALLSVEVETCGRFAATFHDAGIYAPLYRLPTAGFQNSLRELLGAGEISTANATALIEFYSEVETLNRGLDLVAGDLAETLKRTADQDDPGDKAGSLASDGKIAKLHGRNVRKASRIRAPEGELYVKARAAFPLRVSKTTQ